MRCRASPNPIHRFKQPRLFVPASAMLRVYAGSFPSKMRGRSAARRILCRRARPARRLRSDERTAHASQRSVAAICVRRAMLSRQGGRVARDPVGFRRPSPCPVSQPVADPRSRVGQHLRPPERVAANHARRRHIPLHPQDALESAPRERDEGNVVLRQ